MAKQRHHGAEAAGPSQRQLRVAEEVRHALSAVFARADFRDPDWKEAFYGVNYATLKDIKDKYDPMQVFYGLTAVGSDEWVVQPDGRLCSVASG